MNSAEAKALAHQVEIFLLSRGGWVPVQDICTRFAVRERALRQDGDRPGLLDGFAVSSTRAGESGFIHHRYVPTPDWLKVKHRLLRHAIGELRKVRAWDRGRQNTLTGKRPQLAEVHTGQLLLIP